MCVPSDMGLWATFVHWVLVPGSLETHTSCQSKYPLEEVVGWNVTDRRPSKASQGNNVLEAINVMFNLM